MRNYFIEETNQNELMGKNHKNVRRILNYIEHLIILVSTAAGCISISAFASLVGITNPAIGFKNLCNNCRN